MNMYVPVVESVELLQTSEDLRNFDVESSTYVLLTDPSVRPRFKTIYWRNSKLCHCHQKLQ